VGARTEKWASKWAEFSSYVAHRGVIPMAVRDKLASYPFFWAALGDLALRDRDPSRARSWLERGAVVARNDAERAMFLRRLGECATEAPK